MDVDFLLAVRRYRQVLGGRQRRHFHELGYAAHNQRVRLYYRRASVVDEVAKAVARVFVLARGYRYAGGAADEPMPLIVVGVHRLFEPEHVVALRLARKLNRLIVAIGAVGVHKQLDVGAYRLAHNADALHVFVDWRAAYLHLYRARAHLNGGFHFGGEVAKPLALFVVAARYVHRDAVGEPAQQLVNGASRRLALDVPQRDVYAAYGASRYAAPAHKLGLPHLFPQPLVVKRVLPDDELLHILEHAHRHLVADMLAAHIAVAGNALVGFKRNQVERHRGVGVAPVAYGLGPVPAVDVHSRVGDFHSGGSLNGLCGLWIFSWVSMSFGWIFGRLGGLRPTAYHEQPPLCRFSPQLNPKAARCASAKMCYHSDGLP